ncbi:OB-fold domain-containing protein [Rhodococcus sp. DMU1]|uniref:Zn-ribbon domain-containing OB-fold protein n=1 Tax=Rhodococcus sp. DMU1 TaxID=2722825 RepID=UPI00143E286E|nr:OB-fold domain-containing protein [Rhodococcus sp. DMU1]QIX53584.1 DNA-binding protein [Rhodococcus sp. DMU1]
MPYRLIDRTLFTTDIDTGSGDGPALCGSRCADCATVTFPFHDACPRCSRTNTQPHELPREGTLWAFTVQGFEPKSPYRSDGGPFTPYGVGYIDLGEVLVESVLTENDPQRLNNGDRYGLRLIPAFTDPDGTTVLTYAFAPLDSEGQDIR